MNVDVKYTKSLNENECLLEKALFLNGNRPATAKAKGDCEVLYLEQADFEKVIKNELKEYLLNSIYFHDDTIQFQDFVCDKNLGTGVVASLLKK